MNMYVSVLYFCIHISLLFSFWNVYLCLLLFFLVCISLSYVSWCPSLSLRTLTVSLLLWNSVFLLARLWRVLIILLPRPCCCCGCWLMSEWASLFHRCVAQCATTTKKQCNLYICMCVTSKPRLNLPVIPLQQHVIHPLPFTVICINPLGCLVFWCDRVDIR